MFAIKALVLVLVSCAMTGCMFDQQLDDRDIIPKSRINDRPVVEVLYPVHVPPVVVADNTSLSIKADDSGVKYFTVRVPYLGTDSDPDSKIHDVLHYVIGGHADDGTEGELCVNGVAVDDDGAVKFKAGDGAALLDVRHGWVWVSDCPPPNWPQGGCTPNDCEDEDGPAAMSVAYESGQSPDGDEEAMLALTADPWVSWSILTLLKAEWTWIGAIGTEFVFRVKPASDDDPTKIEKAYSLSGCTAVHSARVKSGKKQIKSYFIENAQFRRAINGFHPENPVQYLLTYSPGYSEDKKFVKMVETKVDGITPPGTN